MVFTLFLNCGRPLFDKLPLFLILVVEDFGKNRIKCCEYNLKNHTPNSLLHLNKRLVSIDSTSNIFHTSASSHSIKAHTRDIEMFCSSYSFCINAPICMFFMSKASLSFYISVNIEILYITLLSRIHASLLIRR